MFLLLLLLFFKPQYEGNSADKESTCNAGDPGSIPGLGRSPWEGIGYPLLYSWASLVAQMIKKPPAMRETWVQSLDWEDPLEEGMATHSRILAWRISMDRGAWQAIVHGLAKSQTRLNDLAQHTEHQAVKLNLLPLNYCLCLLLPFSHLDCLSLAWIFCRPTNTEVFKITCNV